MAYLFKSGQYPVCPPAALRSDMICNNGRPPVRGSSLVFQVRSGMGEKIPRPFFYTINTVSMASMCGAVDSSLSPKPRLLPAPRQGARARLRPLASPRLTQLNFNQAGESPGECLHLDQCNYGYSADRELSRLADYRADRYLTSYNFKS